MYDSPHTPFALLSDNNMTSTSESTAPAAVLPPTPTPPQPRLLDTFDLNGVAKYIKEKNVRKALIMMGAGCSVAAGIPDFRSPGTGLYSKLGDYGLESPEQVFSIDLLKEKPQIFYNVANDLQLWPGLFPPTHVHHFVKLLVDEGRVLRVCTQNIDTLERRAGIPEDKLLEAHGSFATAHCINAECKAPYPMDELRRIAEQREVPRCPKCQTVVKPDVVFFGEGLPPLFHEVLRKEAREADFLIVMGTSLKVYPFASLIDAVPDDVPRVLINNERAGDFVFGDDTKQTPAANEAEKEEGLDSMQKLLAALMGVHQRSRKGPLRDVFLQGDCQAVVKALAEKLGLAQSLDAAYVAAKLKYPSPNSQSAFTRNSAGPRQSKA